MVEQAPLASALKWLRNLPWQQLFYMFYIEPVIFMLVFALMLSGTIMRNQVIYQTCMVIFRYNETDCRQLENEDAGAEIHAIETEVQSYISNMFLIGSLVESIVPAICGLFVGAWSDHYGRRPLLVVSMIGFSGSALVMCIICAVSSYTEINPWWYTLASLPHSLLGGMCVLYVASFCFLSDITDINARPYRMIFIELLVFIALSSGTLLSSYVYEATNAVITQGITTVILILATLFTIFYVPESLHIRLAQDAKNEADKADKAEKADKNMPIATCDVQLNNVTVYCPNNTITELSSEQAKSDPGFNKVQLADKPQSEHEQSLHADTKQQSELESGKDENNIGIFNIEHLKDMFRTCCKPREHHAREIIWLVTLAMFVTMFVVDGAMTVMYLFIRQKFHWSVRDISFYQTLSQLAPMLGAIIGFLILRKIFGLSVVTLALISLSMDMLSSVVKGFASLPWHMYLSLLFSIFGSIGGPMCRTIVSNIVPASDLGKIFSIKNVLQSFAPFVAAPLYTFIYQRSLAVYPGLFNFLSAGFFAIAFLAILLVLRYKLMHRQHYADLLK